jgi:hypothetical protein
MRNHHISRRSFVLAGITLPAAAFALPKAAGSPPLTGDEVIQRIKYNVGTPWLDHTVDRIIAGNGGTPVHGIATTMMATLEVLQKAVAAGTNMVITHEPTFYSHEDATEELRTDATFQHKAEFIRKNDLLVFRFHDHWHRRNPDGIALGMTRELGWEKNVDSQDPRLFSFPPTSLVEFVGTVKDRLKPHSMRVLGDPHMLVRKVVANWGYISQIPGINLLARVGGRRIRPGRDLHRKEEGFGSNRACGFRTSRHGLFRPVAEALVSRIAYRVRARKRTILDGLNKIFSSP